jgi:hypothetical protein
MSIIQNRTVVIIGWGIVGAVAAHTLCTAHNYKDDTMTVTVHVFDQGWGRVGGRASLRMITRMANANYDHVSGNRAMGTTAAMLITTTMTTTMTTTNNDDVGPQLPILPCGHPLISRNGQVLDIEGPC